jgi:hypothetical protein
LANWKIPELKKPLLIRVARWFYFRPKNPDSDIFGGPWNEKCCYIFWSFGIFYNH